jgi:hypothetical protein
MSFLGNDELPFDDYNYFQTDGSFFEFYGHEEPNISLSKILPDPVDLTENNNMKLEQSPNDFKTPDQEKIKKKKIVKGTNNLQNKPTPPPLATLPNINFLIYPPPPQLLFLNTPPSEEIKKLCKRHNIHIQVYLTQRKELAHRGYTEEQINAIILRSSSAKTVEVLLKLHKQLLINFSRYQITIMSKHNGGGKNLAEVNKHFDTLETKGFSADDMVEIVSHKGGSNNIRAVTTKYYELTEQGLDNNDIVEMTSHDGGWKNLEVVIEKYDLLRGRGFTKNDIVKMNSFDRGWKTLEAVIKHFDELKNIFRNDAVKLTVAIVSRRDGAKYLEKALEALRATSPTFFSRHSKTNENPSKKRNRDDNENENLPKTKRPKNNVTNNIFYDPW